MNANPNVNSANAKLQNIFSILKNKKAINDKFTQTPITVSRC